jgi:hypothetical protein
MPETKRTSFVRYQRVHTILSNDHALKRKLSTNTVAIGKPDQSFVDFPAEVVAVVDNIHDNGGDVASMSKLDLLSHAHRFLSSNPAIKITQKVPTQKPAPRSRAPKPKAKPAAKLDVPAETNAEEPKAEPVKAEELKPTSAPKAKAAKAKPAPAVDSDQKSGKKTDNAGDAPKFIRPHFPYLVGVAALSLLEGVMQLMQPHVTNGDKEADDVCADTEKLINKVHQYTVLPADAKEESSNTR